VSEVLHLDGLLDSVGVWHREFSDAQLNTLRNAGAGKGYADLSAEELTDLAAFHNLDDTGNPATWIDSHGSSHLTNNNGVTSEVGLV
jgi:hypothetical protein